MIAIYADTNNPNRLYLEKGRRKRDKRLTLRASSHPNRQSFHGVLTVLDKPSDKAPNGARGHRVILTRRAAEQALPSLIGMAVDYKVGWDGHDARQKIGVITTAEIIDNFIVVGGHVFGRDFPEAATKLEGATEMGMSYELADAHVEDMRQSIWTLTRATFTGAAVLFREKAAYRMTDFQLLEAA